MPPGRGRPRISEGGSNRKRKAMKTDDIGIVEEILDYRYVPRSPTKVEFKIKWKNCSEAHNSWLDYDELRMNEILDEFINKIYQKHECEIYIIQVNNREHIKDKIRYTLRTKKKVEIDLEWRPFDWREFRVIQGIYFLYKHLRGDATPETFTKYYQNQLFKAHFFRLDEGERIKNDEFIAQIKAVDSDVNLIIENYEDFTPPPTFKYLTHNILAESDILNSPSKEAVKEIKGCSCGRGKCSKESKCCPKLIGEAFAYKTDKRGLPLMKFNRFEKIIECGEKCKCGPTCLNRVTQQKPAMQFCLFKTENRGWGLKTLKKIKEGTFIIEYCGELLGHHEAGKRNEHRYLIDLNMERNENGFYTIDANFQGSLARFVNHSCEPNAKMWFVNDCNLQAATQKACIFADRDIQADEEITIDYVPKDTVPVDRAINLSRSLVVECNCGTQSCRGNVY